jgi:hypothetical protein
MIDWEVMVSNSNTRWHWGDPVNTPEPAIPWHQHVFPDGTPVSYTEAAAIRRYITGKDDFLFFQDFLNLQANANSEQRHYTVKNTSAFSPSYVLNDGLVELTFWPMRPTPPGSCVAPQVRDMTGADVAQTTYTGNTDAEKDASCCEHCSANDQCEYWVRATDSTRCWLKKNFVSYTASSVRRGNFVPRLKASSSVLDLALRHGTSEYVVRVDVGTAELLLLKGSQQLASFSTRRLDSGVIENGWNMLRVLIRGGSISIWLNPMLPDVFPDSVPVPSGPPARIIAMPPRITYTDAAPLAAGRIEVLAPTDPFRVDYVSVLPPVTYGQAWTP